MLGLGLGLVLVLCGLVNIPGHYLDIWRPIVKSRELSVDYWLRLFSFEVCVSAVSHSLQISVNYYQIPTPSLLIII